MIKISTKERSDSELFYLSFIAKTVPGDDEDKMKGHPQWKALCMSQCLDSIESLLYSSNLCYVPQSTVDLSSQQLIATADSVDT